MPTSRNELAHVLADIDRLLAESEDIAADPEDDGERQAALDFLIEFQETKQRVERLLRDNCK
jgi:hypothetical protein